MAALLCLLFGLEKPAAAQSTEPAKAETVHTNRFMRVSTPDTNTIQLQIAVRELLPATKGTPTVWLVGAAHIGETNYYQALQKHLDAQELVLFEGVHNVDAHDDERPRSPEVEKPGRKPEMPEVDEESLQPALAKSLGLAFQLSAIQYERPNFRNSDMSIDQIARVLNGGRDPVPAAEGEGQPSQFGMLLQLMDGSSFLGKIANAVVRMLGTSPQLQATTKVMFIEILGNLQGDLSQMAGLPPDMKHLLTVLLHARNDVVVQDLKAELRKPKPPRSIAIFYGAAHLEPMQEKICKELDYHTGETRWLPAITVDIAKSGLSGSDLKMIRSMVKWQMQMLQANAQAEATPPAAKEKEE